MALAVGDEAPAISANDTEGRPFHLRSLRGQKNVVLFFFPRAFTPGCTREVCAFRDAYDELVSQDTEVIGVSTDSLDRQSAFSKAHRLPFRLLADPDQNIARAFGVVGGIRKWFGIAARVTFVIDKAGVVRGVFHHELLIDAHVRDVKRLLASLR